MCNLFANSGSYVYRKGQGGLVRLTSTSPLHCSHVKHDYTRPRPGFFVPITQRLRMKFDAGRWIAYGGGSGVSATSLAAKAEMASMAITPTPGEFVSVLNMQLAQFGGVQLVAADVVSIGGIALVVLRLAFDVWKYIDQRRREGGNDATK